MRGKRVGILESRLGPQMADLVARHGGEPLLAPALAEIPDMDRGFIAGLIAQLDTQPAQVAIFQTGVGTQALFKTTDDLRLTERFIAQLAKMTVVVRGPKPTGPLRARQVRLDRSAAEPFTTTEILAALQDVPLRGARVLVQRYGVSNRELDEALRAAGAEIIEIPTYRWSVPEDTVPLVRLMDSLDGGKLHAVAFTNAAQAYNLFDLAERLGRAERLRAGLNGTLVASVGPVCSDALKKLGVAVALEADPPKLGPLIAALNTRLAG